MRPPTALDKDREVTSGAGKVHADGCQTAGHIQQLVIHLPATTGWEVRLDTIRQPSTSGGMALHFPLLEATLMSWCRQLPHGWPSRLSLQLQTDVG